VFKRAAFIGTARTDEPRRWSTFAHVDLPAGNFTVSALMRPSWGSTQLWCLLGRPGTGEVSGPEVDVHQIVQHHASEVATFEIVARLAEPGRVEWSCLLEGSNPGSFSANDVRMQAVEVDDLAVTELAD
jgi:hypothetical protein